MEMEVAISSQHKSPRRSPSDSAVLDGHYAVYWRQIISERQILRLLGVPGRKSESSRVKSMSMSREDGTETMIPAVE